MSIEYLRCGLDTKELVSQQGGWDGKKTTEDCPNYKSDAVAEGKERQEGPARAGQVSQ